MPAWAGVGDSGGRAERRHGRGLFWVGDWKVDQAEEGAGLASGSTGLILPPIPGQTSII